MGREASRRFGERSGRRGGGGFTYDYMTSLGQLAMVHDFGVAASVASSGGVIDSIADLSGNSNTLTAAAAARPAYSLADSEFAGQDCAICDGVDDVLRIASATLGGTMGPGALGIVLKLVSNVNGDVCQSYNTTSFRHVEATTSRISSSFGASVITTADSFTARAHLLVSVADGTNLVRYVDGVAVGTPVAFTGTAASGSAYALGATSAGTAGWSNVKIALAFMSLTALTAQQVADLGAYCRTRFGTP